MIFNQTTHKDLRDIFCNAVTKVFGDSTTFLDFLENEEYSVTKYDCYIDCNGENYIINRETGEYINWYKFTHIGRDIHISAFNSCNYHNRIHYIFYHKCKRPYRLRCTYEYSWLNNIPKWIEEFLVEFKESEE